jgi:signal transduction histidine kinase
MRYAVPGQGHGFSGMCFFRFCCFVFLFALSPGGRAESPASAPVVRLESANAPVRLGLSGALDLLDDREGGLAINRVAAPDMRARFSTLAGNLGLGYTRSAAWLRFTVDRPADVSGDWLLEILPPYLDDLRLFEPDGLGGFRERRAGDELPYAARDVGYRGFVFPLSVPDGKTTYYLQLRSTSSLIAIPTLWPAEIHRQAVRDEYLLFGLANGLMLATGLFALLVWIYVREPLLGSFGVLALLQFAVVVTLQGFTSEYLLPDQPRAVGVLTGVLVGLATAQTYLFFDLLLDAKRHFPLISRVYRWSIAISLLTALSAPLGFYSQMAPVLMFVGLFSNVLVYWPCRDRWRAGGLSNWVEIVALLVYILLASLHLVGLLGIGPVSLKILNANALTTLVYLLLLEFSVLLRIGEANRRRLTAEAEAGHERMQREDQGRFLAMIAHELRTPISIVSATLQSLQLIDANPEEARKKRYAKIERAVRRMDSLLQGCMAEERLVSGGWLASEDGLCLAQLTRSVLDELGETARAALVIDAERGVPAVRGERSLLRVVLRNLIENARKYAPEERPVEIEVGAHDDAGRPGVSWRITDSGSGVSPELAERIFEKYFRGSESSGTPGFGLGLYLSRRIVERHGGWLRLDTAHLVGASFICWLPIEFLCIEEGKTK